jgi:hypothetical protein
LLRGGPGERKVLLGHRREWQSDLGIVEDGSPVEVGEAKERLDGLDGVRSWPLEDGADFGRVHLEAVWSYDVAKVLDGTGMKLALGGLAVKSVVGEKLEDCPDMGSMVRGVGGVDEDVVEVDDDEVVDVLVEDIVDEVLERGRSVGEAEGHDEKIERAVAGPEGRLPFVPEVDPEQVVGTSEINLSEDLGGGELLKERGDRRDRIAVFAGPSIELPVIDAKPKSPVLLLGEYDRGTDRRLRRSDEAFGEKLVDVELEGFGLGLGGRVDGTDPG